MWPTHCPKTKGLRCDCFVHYCVLLAALFACLVLFVMGSLCLLGVGRNGEGEEQSMFSTCIGLGSLGGWALLLIGCIFPCCYTICFVILGEGGRKTITCPPFKMLSCFLVIIYPFFPTKKNILKPKNHCEMWATRCPKTVGLRCDCVVQYCVLISVYIACLGLFIMGSLCLQGKGRNGEGEEEAMLSTCLGLGSLGGWIILIIGCLFPCCYTLFFVFLGEGGRKAIGLKNVNDIPE